MPDLAESVIEFVRQHDETAIWRTLRSTVAATLAFVVALWLTPNPAPLLAPLTALLVVQVTLYATLTSGLRRVNAVVAGVTVSVVFSALVGLSWWSLGLLILFAQASGYMVRAGEFVPEAAISAMLVLAVAETPLGRLVETLIGAVVGLLFNAVFIPPVWVSTAGAAIQDLAGGMRRLLLHLARELGGRTPVERAADTLYEARRLDQEVGQVDVSLTRAEDSLRLNPRVREGVLSRIVLRTGLDTLEVCIVILRTITRTITELATKRTDEPLFPPEVSAALADLLTHLAATVGSFGVLITTQVSSSAEEAETRMVSELEASRAARERVAYLLLDRVQEHPRQWQLHGSLLAEIDRILNELDVEQRSMRLAEELDSYSRAQRERFPLWEKVKRRLGPIAPRGAR